MRRSSTVRPRFRSPPGPFAVHWQARGGGSDPSHTNSKNDPTNTTFIIAWTFIWTLQLSAELLFIGPSVGSSSPAESHPNMRLYYCETTDKPNQLDCVNVLQQTNRTFLPLLHFMYTPFCASRICTFAHATNDVH
jgi:hypothetical protein